MHAAFLQTRMCNLSAALAARTSWTCIILLLLDGKSMQLWRLTRLKATATGAPFLAASSAACSSAQLSLAR